MGYFAYYFAWIALTFVLRYPPLAAGLVVLFLLRQFIPDPFVLVRTMGRTRALARQIEANPANVTARRDLAMVYIDRLRPGRALALLEEARKRFPDDAELLYLSGLAHAKRGDAAEAVPLLVRAVQIDPRVRFGEPYLVVGDALRKLGRTEDALDAFERFVGLSSSSVEGHVKLALTHRALRDDVAARAALDEAIRTFAVVPGYQKRAQFGWWLRAQVARWLV